jgi:hypothetical protein
MLIEVNMAVTSFEVGKQALSAHMLKAAIVKETGLTLNITKVVTGDGNANDFKKTAHFCNLWF